MSGLLIFIAMAAEMRVSAMSLPQFSPGMTASREELEAINS